MCVGYLWFLWLAVLFYNHTWTRLVCFSHCLPSCRPWVMQVLIFVIVEEFHHAMVCWAVVGRVMWQDSIRYLDGQNEFGGILMKYLSTRHIYHSCLDDLWMVSVCRWCSLKVKLNCQTEIKPIRCSSVTLWHKIGNDTHDMSGVEEVRYGVWYARHCISPFSRTGWSVAVRVASIQGKDFLENLLSCVWPHLTMSNFSATKE